MVLERFRRFQPMRFANVALPNGTAALQEITCGARASLFLALIKALNSNVLVFDEEDKGTGRWHPIDM